MRKPPGRSRAGRRAPLLTIAEIAALLLLCAFGAGFPRGPAMLLLGPIWALVAAFAQLATFVPVSGSDRP